MRVFKWGKYLAVRLPAGLIGALALRAGDEIELRALRAREPEVRQASDVRKLIANLRKYRGRLPAGFRFSRELAQERG